METVNIEELVQDQHNFNKGTEEGARLMEKSFTELGAGRSILIDKDGNIIAGNKSQKAAMAAGIKKVRVIESDGTELIAVKRTDISIDSKEGRELALADNLTTQVNLAWDNVELASVAAEQGIDLPDWGLDPKDLGIEEPTETKEAQEDDFDEEKDKVETVCKKGDIWQLGNHRLMCGDSTKPKDVARLMDGEKADMCFTDPPYGVKYKVKASASDGNTISQARKEGCKHESIINDGDLQTAYEIAKGALSLIADIKSIYICCDWKSYATMQKATEEAGIVQKACIVWDKGGPYQHLDKFAKSHEFIIYAGPFGGQKTVDVDIWKEPREFRPDHPTPKSIKLIARALGYSSKEADIVLDLFGGSGSTLIACEQLGRKCYMMELDPHYCDVIIARWEKLTGQTATKL